MKKTFCAITIILALVFAGVVNGQTLPEVTYQWTEPTTGSFAETYVVEYTDDGVNWEQLAIVDTTQITIRDIFANHNTYQIRVAGVDALGRQGPFSVPSIPYTVDFGVPGIPGQPIFIE